MNPPIITSSPVCTKQRVLILPRIEPNVAAKIVHFHESNSSHVIYTTDDRGVVTWLAGTATIAILFGQLGACPTVDDVAAPGPW